MTNEDNRPTDAVFALNPSIIDPPAFNSRVSFDEDEVISLMEEIKRDGQRQPVEVYANDGRYVLNFGSRRVAACLRGDMLVKAIIVPAPETDKDKVFRNAVENLQREDLTTFEQARTFAKLRELDTKVDEIAGRLGFTKGYVSEMTKNYVKLAPVIREAWERSSTIQRERNPGKLAARQAAEIKACSAMFLRELVGEPEAKQVELFESAVNDIMKEREAVEAEAGARSGRSGRSGSSAAGTIYKVSSDRYATVNDAIIKAGKSGPLDVKLVRLFVQYLVGDIEKVKGHIEPEAKPGKEPAKK